MPEQAAQHAAKPLARGGDRRCLSVQQRAKRRRSADSDLGSVQECPVRIATQPLSGAPLLARREKVLCGLLQLSLFF
jgi:hypothetical protein